MLVALSDVLDEVKQSVGVTWVTGSDVIATVENCGDRPRGSLIFQGFPDVGQLTPLVWTSFAGLPPGGYP